MSKWQEYFVIYLETYVKAVGGDREEFFLSFCDVEEEFLKGLDTSDLTEYCVIVVNDRDYSEAVRMRNAPDVPKIVLLSGEGIKQIDSLKDFNEYPIMAENREVLWNCLKKALSLTAGFHNDAKAFLSVILDHSEVALSTLMKYLDSSVKTTIKPQKVPSGPLQKKQGQNAGISRRVLLPEKLNENLSMLGIWKSRKTSYLYKGEINRILRASKYNVVESRLIKAVMNGKMAGKPFEKSITDGLASGDIEKIFKNVYYDDIKDFLKAPARNASPGETRPTDIEDIVYENSYQCYLLEDSGKTVAEIEAEWMADREQEDSDEEQEWKKYQLNQEDLDYAKEQFLQLKNAVWEMGSEEPVIQETGHKIHSLQLLFEESWEAVSQATPICLDKFCSGAAAYTQKYLELLAFVLNNSKMRSAVAGTGVTQRLQMLFCRTDGATVKMPFYHPVCVFYYMCVREMYRFAVKQQKKNGKHVLKDQIWHAMIQKAGMQFPIEYMTVDGKIYALDHAEVWQSGNILFENQDFGAVYSSLDFRTINRQILEYLERHPFLTHIRIAVMDISSLTGLVQLVNKILQFSQQAYCNIGKVEFLILSAREDELKKELSALWDSIGTGETVRFRFGRNGYWNGRQYEMGKIMGESDITIVADNSMLYLEPRKAAYYNNGLKNRLSKIELETQVERYFTQQSIDIAVLWDSMQNIAENREEGYRIWKNREIDNGLLSDINGLVSNCPGKAVILLSSNEHILSEIFRTQYIHAHQGGYNSRNITIIEFENDNQRKRLSDKGEPQVSYSVRDFYDTVLGLEDVTGFFSDFLEDIYLEFGYREGVFYCECQMMETDGDDSDGEWKMQCFDWVQWQMKSLISRENVLGIYFRNAILTYLLERVENVSSVLLLERLSVEDFRPVIEDMTVAYVREKAPRARIRAGDYAEKDCMEALKMHEIIKFARNKASIDEQTTSQFKERYETKLLKHLIKCNEMYGLLTGKDRDKLQKIQERISE
ncbi:MAG: hypothetical protein NC331_01875 [Lachnospiraceae bacterium]|nr:hypothetical protein [Lachnospiraceae bacterium]MCM1238115.1 hypothetical protein [Lachnospiraceae bacterium]